MMGEFAQMIAVAILLATVNNGAVEYLFSFPFEELGIDKKWLLYVSVLTAQVIVFAFDVNLFVGIGIHSAAANVAAKVLTGLLIARGSNYIADLPWSQAQAGT